MNKLLLACLLGVSVSTPVFAQTKDVKDLYFFQIKSGDKVLTEFEQKVSFKDLEKSDFSYQHQTKYYKDCRSSSSEMSEVTEGATGIVTYDDELDLEQLHISFDVNSSRKAGLCHTPKMENFEISLGFPFLSTEQTVEGNLGNTYTVKAGRVRIDQDSGEVVYPKF